MLGGDAWRAWAEPLMHTVGAIPHAALETAVKREKKQTSRMLKCECAECGAIWRLSSKVVKQVIASHEERFAAFMDRAPEPFLRCVDPGCPGEIDALPLVAGDEPEDEDAE